MHNIGIDIGSSCAKVCIMKDGKIEKNFMIPSGYNSRETAELIKNILLEDGVDIEKSKITATGYGRISVPFADQVMTEITATVRDIGGQDTKVISLKRGRVMKFIMNDKCSAGTGKFMEIMSNRLGLTLEELEELASNGNDISISSMCTVFADSDLYPEGSG